MLTQKGLIKKIISATNLVATSALGMDCNGELMTDEWSYPSIVGMLLYLSMNTRPDIAFTVIQVTCFSYSSKQSHASAIKQIVHYLSHTWDKGMIVKPTNTYGLIVMLMLILQVFTNVILIQALQVPSLTLASLFLLAEYLLCGTHSFSQKFPSALLRVNTQVCHRLCIPFCQSAHSCWKWHRQSDFRRHLLPLLMQGSSRITMELTCWL
jgi:hypothetical protein